MPDYSANNPYQRLLAEALRSQGVEVALARVGRLPLPLVRAWLVNGRPDVLHLHWTHEFLFTPRGRQRRLAARHFTWQLRLLRALGVRIVWTVHNLGRHDGRRDSTEMTVHRRLAAMSAVVICHCAAACEAAARAFGLPPDHRERLHVVPHGSYLGAYPDTVTREEARDALGLARDARVLLFLGAVRGYKGTADLVKAFRAIDDPAARLVIAGRPSPARVAGHLSAVAGGDPRILLELSFVPDDRVQVYLRAADAVVLPFRDILTSGSAILALSFGRPVVAPALGCLPETIPGDAGILYDPAAPDALAGALRLALASDLDTMGRRALAAAEALDWRLIAARTAALYRA